MNDRNMLEIFLHRVNRKVNRLWAGLDTPKEFCLLLLDYLSLCLTGKNPRRQLRAFIRRMADSVQRTDDFYQLGKARLPLLDPETEQQFFGSIFEDIFFSYLHCGDCYDEKSMEKYYYLLVDGPYGLRNDVIDVRVQEGDVVLDAGSWIGDFAAYASAKGAAAVYAFEPVDATFRCLERTAELNPGIFPVKKGLSDREGLARFSDNATDVGNAITSEGGQEIELTTVDAFVRERGLERVDFIKADIEGAERDMLRGARETLARFAPKLALCTYHFPDDPEVMAALIKEANPAYHIVQKHKKLFAAVPGKTA